MRLILFFNKVIFLFPATLLKRGIWHRYFPVSFVKLYRLIAEHLWMAVLILWGLSISAGVAGRGVAMCAYVYMGWRVLCLLKATVDFVCRVQVRVYWGL